MKKLSKMRSKLINSLQLNNFIKAQELEKNKKIEKIKNKISDIKKEYEEIDKFCNNDSCEIPPLTGDNIS